MKLRDSDRRWLLERSASMLLDNGKVVGFCETTPDDKGNVHSWGIKEYSDGTVGPDTVDNWSYHPEDVGVSVRAKLALTLAPVL
jgi:hypothetical protein